MDSSSVAATKSRLQNSLKNQQTSAKIKCPSNNQSVGLCASCGGMHLRQFRTVMCRHVGKIGHIAKVYRSGDSSSARG